MKGDARTAGVFAITATIRLGGCFNAPACWLLATLADCSPAHHRIASPLLPFQRANPSAGVMLRYGSNYTRMNRNVKQSAYIFALLRTDEKKPAHGEVSAWTPGTQTVVRHCIDSAIHSRI